MPSVRLIATASRAVAARRTRGDCNATRIGCGAQETRAVTVNGDPTLAYTRAGRTDATPVVLQARLTELELGEAAFGTLFRAVHDGAAVGQAIVLPLSGPDAATNETVTLVLALPTPLRANTTIPLGRRAALAPRPLADSARAEVGLSVGTYHLPPPEWRTTFAATTASGTVRVGRQYDPGYELVLDLLLADATGRTVRLAGKAGVFPERYTPPCT